MALSCLKAFISATVSEESCPKLVGLSILFCALAGPIVLLTGGLMFAVHSPHTLVPGNGTLFAVQSDQFFHIVVPETYSWCIYALEGTCANGEVVQVGARRDDFAYNGLGKVSPKKCFEDAEIINKPVEHETWSADRCLPVGSNGVVKCLNPRPVVRAWYQPERCTAWTLNDPSTLIPRFTAITVVGAVCLGLGWLPMCAIWCARGRPMDEFDSI